MGTMTVPDSLLKRVGILTGIDPEQALRDLQEASDRLAALRHDAAGVTAELAAYRAQFFGGASSHYEHERSSILAGLVEATRAERSESDGRVTEAELQAKARAHEGYKDWLDQKYTERKRLYQLEADLARLDARIEEARMEREHALQVLRLNEELIRMARAEANGL